MTIKKWWSNIQYHDMKLYLLSPTVQPYHEYYEFAYFQKNIQTVHIISKGDQNVSAHFNTVIINYGNMFYMIKPLKKHLLL